MKWSDPLTVEGEERMMSMPDHPNPQLRLPFGKANDRWEKIKAKMLPGDELRWFSTDRSAARALASRSGIALIRDGIIIDEINMLVS